MDNIKKCLSCRKLFNKFKTLVLPHKYLFSLVPLVDKTENFHILKCMLQIQCKHHWLLPGWCAQYYKRTKLYNTLLIFKPYVMKQKDLTQHWINNILFHSYSVDFFFSAENPYVGLLGYSAEKWTQCFANQHECRCCRSFWKHPQCMTHYVPTIVIVIYFAFDIQLCRHGISKYNGLSHQHVCRSHNAFRIIHPIGIYTGVPVCRCTRKKH